ncbi:MAG: radical SAM protein [Firmicutes bacterium]|nr:radical SAM protein [Bacillota bacterium]
MYSLKDFPSIIEIQFHNVCNSNCLICPYKKMNYIKEYMDDKLFEKFLSEIDNSNLKRIIPYLNNEPFLEKTYVEKLKKIRHKLPKVEIEISTNVSCLSEQNIKELLNINLTELRLSVFGYYDNTYKKMMPCLNKEIVFKKLNIISKYFKNTKTIVSIVMIDTGDINEEEFKKMELFAKSLGFQFERWGFLDRSKNVEYKSNNFYCNNVCGCEQKRPLERMHILSNGNVILCCQDWSHQTIIGNIRNNTISEIWNSTKYNTFRKMVYSKNVEAPEICKNCKLALTYIDRK